MGNHIIRDAILGYEIVIDTAIADETFFDATLIAQPRITGMLPKHADDACILDITALRKSLADAESGYPVTCTCGIPDDTGIHAPIHFSRDNDTICWHFDMHDHRVLFEDSLSLDTSITLRFDLARYTATVNSLLADIHRWLAGPVTAGELRRLGCIMGCLPPEDDTLVETSFMPMNWFSGDVLPELA